MDEVRCRVARMFEAHLPVDETSQLNPKFVTDEAAAIGLLIETIDEYVVGRLKSWYITEGTEHP